MNSKRVLSLDILRGITVAAMIMVNNAGGEVSYAALRHSVWNGLTPCDLVFPFFLFIVGVSTFLSLRKYDCRPSRTVLIKIIRRTALLLVLGWLLHAIELLCAGDFDVIRHLRLTGVLPRIALCYAAAAFAALYIPRRRVPLLIFILLAAYSVLLVSGHGYSLDGNNILSVIDRSLLGEHHLYRKGIIDPEGLLSTFPAIAHTLIGFCCGALLTGKDSDAAQRTLRLTVAGFILFVAGYALSGVLPPNKRIWSPSFVLLTCGVAAMSLGTLAYIIDMPGRCRRCRLFEVYGVNPLFLYVLSEAAATIISASGAKQTIYAGICLAFPDPYFASLVYAVLFAALFGIIGYVLYIKKIFIKL